LGTWGTHEELDENTMKTSKELFENKRNQTPTALPKGKKPGPLDACYLTSLAARSFFAYLSSLPFWPRLMAGA
jgi:hypothetical protein